MKNVRLDKSLIYAAYIYITIPFIVFLTGWIKWYYSIPLCVIICASLFFCLNEYKNSFISIYVKPHRRKIIIALCFILIWVFFSGIGGFSYQTWDHNFRNAIFRDLVTHDWPVLYQVKGFGSNHPLEGQTCMMAYYMGYWLPSAIIGKVFGWHAANVFLFLWTVAGILLVFYFICRLFKLFSIKFLLLFIFWGTAYVIGLFIKYPVTTLIKSEAVLWAGNMFYADNNTGLLYWVFNQSLTPWLIIILVLNHIPHKNIFFLSGLCFFQGPLAFLGLLPFAGYILFKEYFKKQISFRRLISALSSFQNIAGAFSILLVSILFFSSNSAAQRFAFVPRNVWVYLLFIFLSFGIIAFLLFHRNRKEPLFYISILLLLPLPFFQLGYGLDFCARVSIAPMFILMLLVMKNLLEERTVFRKNILIAYLSICSILPSLQILRSVTLTSLQYLSDSNTSLSALSHSNNFIAKKITSKVSEARDHNLLIKDDFYTLDNPLNYSVGNFMGPVNQSFFYKYLAKRTD